MPGTLERPVPSSRPSATAGCAEPRRVQPTRCCAPRSPNSATSISSGCWWRRFDWHHVTATSLLCCMNESGSAVMRIAPRSRWPEKSWLTCRPWIDARRTSSAEGSSGQLWRRENLPREEKTSGSSMRRMPGPADYRPGDGGNSRGSLRSVSGLAVNTNSIFCDASRPEAANGCPVLQRMQEPSAERHTCAAAGPDQTNNALSRARPAAACFFLGRRLTWMPVIRHARRTLAGTPIPLSLSAYTAPRNRTKSNLSHF